ncbi:universal stress protein [Nonomuraea ferruginea]
MVGVDGRGGGDAALMWAAGEARRAGARLVVVHAWESRARAFAPPTRAPRAGTAPANTRKRSWSGPSCGRVPPIRTWP